MMKQIPGNRWYEKTKQNRVLLTQDWSNHEKIKKEEKKSKYG